MGRVQARGRAVVIRHAARVRVALVALYAVTLAAATVAALVTALGR